MDNAALHVPESCVFAQISVFESIEYDCKRSDPATCESHGPAMPCMAPRQGVRDFIHDSLYHPEEGYFSRGPSVGTPSVPIDFPSLGNELAYFDRVQSLYTSLQAAWLTPVEIFQPHYGAAVAACLAARWEAAGVSGPLHIYEIGGGTGVLARNILDYLRANHPRAYASCRYTSVEISGALAAAQASRLRADAGHAARFVVEQRDGADRSGWGAGVRHARPCFVLAMEVLDNMPHDLAVRRGRGAWRQVSVETRAGAGAQGAAPTFHEAEGPVTDPLIARTLAAAETVAAGRPQSVWRATTRLLPTVLAPREKLFLPTGALRLLDTLRVALPRHALLAADFDQLPEVTILGRNAPLVATTEKGTTRDHGTYLVPRGTADIFFPTDFPLLQALHADAGAHAARDPGTTVASSVAKSAAFMARWARPGATRTRSGYDPLLSDYSNTSMFLGGCTELCATPLLESV